MKCKTKGKSRSFVMLDRELLSSIAWRSMGINCRRLLDFLLIEHLSKGGKENGSLKATYDQLAKFGISRRLIHPTLSEAESLGIIRVERGGRRGCTNEMSTFTVTFLRTFNGEREVAPTNDWMKVLAENCSRYSRKRIFKSALRKRTFSVPLHPSSQFH